MAFLVFFLLLFPVFEARAQFDKGRLPVLVIVQFRLNSNFEDLNGPREERRLLRERIKEEENSLKNFKDDIKMTKEIKARIQELQGVLEKLNAWLIPVEDTEAIRGYVAGEIKKFNLFDIIALKDVDEYTAQYNIDLNDIYRPEYYSLFDGLDAGFIISGDVETLWKNAETREVTEYKIVLNLINVKKGKTYQSAIGSVRPNGRSIKVGVEKLVDVFFKAVNLSQEDLAEAYVEPEYKIGQAGPGGGIIFFVKGNHSGGWRYLEAAPNDIDTPFPWGYLREGVWQPDLSGTREELGAGKRNTEIINMALSSEGTQLVAAQVCQTYSSNGLRDWFLPSKDELNLLYRNLALRGLGNFAHQSYWSSSQSSKSTAWFQTFDNGRSYPNGRKSDKFRIRPIRAF